MTLNEAEKLAAYLTKLGGNKIAHLEWLRMVYPARIWEMDTGKIEALPLPSELLKPIDKPTPVDEGGPAFPIFKPDITADDWEYFPGMSLRTWLAGQIATRIDPDDYDDYEHGATDVFAFADALIAEGKR